MKNRYEFNIEDIEEVFVQTINDQNKYSTRYIRKNDKEFIVIYYALTDYTDPSAVKWICERCGTWNTYLGERSNIENAECEHCNDDYEECCEEDDLIETILSFMDEDIFKDIKLCINDIEII